MGDARIVVKIALASGLAWWLGNLAGQDRPVFAALVPIVVIRSVTTETLGGSLGRVLGVLVGVCLGLAALAIARPSPVMVGIVVGVAIVVDRLLSRIPRLETRNQTAVSALLMMFVASAVTSYAVARVWETAIGAAVAMSVEWVDQLARRRFRHSPAGGTS